MDQPAHLLPLTAHADALIGFDFALTVELFADEQQTKPANLTGLTITAEVGGVFQLASGRGLEIDRKAGVVVLRLTSEQTASIVWTVPPPVHHYALRVVDKAGFAVCPVAGDISYRHS